MELEELEPELPESLEPEPLSELDCAAPSWLLAAPLTPLLVSLALSCPALLEAEGRGDSSTSLPDCRAACANWVSTQPLAGLAANAARVSSGRVARAGPAPFPSIARVVIEVFPMTDADDGDEESEPEEVFLVRLEAGPARAFVKRAELVIEAGRPDCPFCGNPIDPEGHLCVRANGFRRRDPA